MQPKLSLPLAAEALNTPTVEQARRRLGGRASTEKGAGELVRLRGDALDLAGVVLFARGSELDVMTAGNTVRRVSRRAVTAWAGEAPAALGEVATRARAFAELEEGQTVRFRDGDETIAVGTLIEKCRYGALILRTDETIRAVGFKRVWAVAEPGAA